MDTLFWSLDNLSPIKRNHTVEFFIPPLPHQHLKTILYKEIINGVF